MTAMIVVFVAVSGPADAKTEVDEALASYHKGIAAQTIGAREQYFEKALELYLANYNQMKRQGQVNGLLCYNIGNCYFNLGQNEEAIFYYQLGKKLLPGNTKITANLAEALAKRKDAVDMESGGLLESVLFFHYKLSTAQQIKGLVGISILAALSLVWLLIRPTMTARYAAFISGFAVSCLVVSLAVKYYMPTHMGVVMKTSDVRRGAGSGFAPITGHPLGGGSSIEVISMADGWYTVKLNDGRQGFIKQENLKVVAM